MFNMSNKRRIIFIICCSAITLLCTLARPGALLEPKGLLLLALTNYFIYRVCCITRRSRKNIKTERDD